MPRSSSGSEGVTERLSFPVTIYHARQDDPKKCTARKMARYGLIRLVESPRGLPPGSILLDPFAERALSPRDASEIRRAGLSAVDCSWETARETFASARSRGQPRALPYLVAANPVHYGQPVNLSTAEAVAATAIICGLPVEADKVLRLWNWGRRFLEVNREPLAAYAACRTSGEIVRAMRAFLPPQWEGGASEASS